MTEIKSITDGYGHGMVLGAFVILYAATTVALAWLVLPRVATVVTASPALRWAAVGLAAGAAPATVLAGWVYTRQRRKVS
jgi:hypothetical protein